MGDFFIVPPNVPLAEHVGSKQPLPTNDRSEFIPNGRGLVIQNVATSSNDVLYLRSTDTRSQSKLPPGASTWIDANDSAKLIFGLGFEFYDGSTWRSLPTIPASGGIKMAWVDESGTWTWRPSDMTLTESKDARTSVSFVLSQASGPSEREEHFEQEVQFFVDSKETDSMTGQTSASTAPVFGNKQANAITLDDFSRLDIESPDDTADSPRWHADLCAYREHSYRWLDGDDSKGQSLSCDDTAGRRGNSRWARQREVAGHPHDRRRPLLRHKCVEAPKHFRSKPCEVADG